MVILYGSCADIEGKGVGRGFYPVAELSVVPVAPGVQFPLRKEGRKAGRKAGRTDGRTDGRKEGKKERRKDGKTEGRKEGKKE